MTKETITHEPVLTRKQVLKARAITATTIDYPRTKLNSIFIFQKKNEDEIVSFYVPERYWYLKNADNYNDYYDSELMLDQLVTLTPEEAVGIIFDNKEWDPK